MEAPTELALRSNSRLEHYKRIGSRDVQRSTFAGRAFSESCWLSFGFGFGGTSSAFGAGAGADAGADADSLRSARSVIAALVRGAHGSDAFGIAYVVLLALLMRWLLKLRIEAPPSAAASSSSASASVSAK